MSSHLILTEAYSEILLKPFKNSLKVHYCPVNATVSQQTLSTLINKIAPKRVISPYDINIIQPSGPCVIDMIAKG